ncbi:MAG TPA: hypothetical protein VGU61_13930 [Noviherbaspirillum sp.]|jgi:hypothetical protein|uniref:hypothetical protein n=1 Tax=Noviherbaspirillum sp. TaxID=1926288 RepID=UPI002DDD1230|nr:hypothetical protein [Noviherbaspirillum sp.]HEV2611363.1 hypothetical protein [Noviherbaspirillum sp.]
MNSQPGSSTPCARTAYTVNPSLDIPTAVPASPPAEQPAAIGRHRQRIINFFSRLKAADCKKADPVATLDYIRLRNEPEKKQERPGDPVAAMALKEELKKLGDDLQRYVEGPHIREQP